MAPNIHSFRCRNLSYSNDDTFYASTRGGVVNNFNYFYDRTIWIFRFGVNPFVGVKYYFTARLSLGVETGFSIFYFEQKSAEIHVEQGFINGQLSPVYVKYGPVKSNGIQTKFNNLRFVTIGYTF
jgi:hypothetical protein